MRAAPDSTLHSLISPASSYLSLFSCQAPALAAIPLFIWLRAPRFCFPLFLSSLSHPPPPTPKSFVCRVRQARQTTRHSFTQAEFSPVSGSFRTPPHSFCPLTRSVPIRFFLTSFFLYEKGNLLLSPNTFFAFSRPISFLN
ncbi:hypothetical protein BDZ91DRAFT_415121 [Kalaharituber pfeilii]|nr:hypothetical protein BDZ91DRAFT_415121 [Kalaharituber pfeilii]